MTHPSSPASTSASLATPRSTAVPAAEYAQHFAAGLDRLVRLIAQGAARVAEQKTELRALREAATNGEVTILAAGDILIVNGMPQDGDAATSDGLLGRLTVHGVPRLFIARDAEAADLLLAARALAQPPAEDTGPAALDLRTVRFSQTFAPPRATPAIGQAAFLLAAARQAPLTPAHLAAVEPAAEPEPAPPPPTGLVPGGEHSRALLRDIAGAERSLDDDALCDRLATTTVVSDLTRLLDEAAQRAEAAARENDAARLATLLTATARREQASDDTETRLAFHVAMRRLLVVPHLRLAAQLLPRQPEQRDDLLLVLARAAEDGADVVIEHLVAAQSPSDRRAYFNALVRLQAGVPALVHMLGDPRWYVVRNAAELLGELDAQTADDAVARTFGHEDDRVRRAAAAALGRLATGRACHALRDALRDPDAGVRGTVALALAGSGWPYATAALRRALADEQDAEAQFALITALGRTASDEAVDALAELAEPPRGFFRRRGGAPRTAAVHALAEAGTPRAREVLARLARDRDLDVRELATRALDGSPAAAPTPDA